MENQSSPIKCREPTEAPPNASSDSFQMIRPNEKKRQQILAIAKKETDNYNEFIRILVNYYKSLNNSKNY